MKLDPVDDALRRIVAGATADSQESETLDFKMDPHRIVGARAPRNPEARLIEELVDAVVCFANAGGGRIVLGVADKVTGTEAIIGTDADTDRLRNRIFAKTRPSLTVPIEEITYLDKRLLVITVPVGLDLITDSKGKAIARRGTNCVPLPEDARRALAHERRNPDFTGRVSAMPPSEVTPQAVAQARQLLARLVDKRQQLATLDDASLLRALNLVDRDGSLLVAGEILLCRPDHDMLDLLTRKMAGSEPSTRRYREPLVLLLPMVLDAMRLVVNPEATSISLSGGQEIAIPDYSPIAIDEAVTNALVHRDYALPDRVVIDTSPTSIRVWSPGGLPFGVTADRLLSTVSTPRNTALMGAMQQLGLAERASRGIDRMYREQARLGQQLPGIRADEYSVEVYFTSGAPNRAFAGFVAGLPAGLRENIDAILALLYLCDRATMTAQDAANLLQVTAEEARDRIDSLTVGADALFTRDGDRRRGVRWRLLPSVATELGTAVRHRSRATSARPRVEAHLDEYGWITNKTIRNMFAVDVQQASIILQELRGANLVEIDPMGPKRGPNIRWVPVAPKRRRR